MPSHRDAVHDLLALRVTVRLVLEEADRKLHPYAGARLLDELATPRVLELHRLAHVLALHDLGDDESHEAEDERSDGREDVEDVDDGAKTAQHSVEF